MANRILTTAFIGFISLMSFSVVAQCDAKNIEKLEASYDEIHGLLLGIPAKRDLLVLKRAKPKTLVQFQAFRMQEHNLHVMALAYMGSMEKIAQKVVQYNIQCGQPSIRWKRVVETLGQLQVVQHKLLRKTIKDAYLNPMKAWTKDKEQRHSRVVFMQTLLTEFGYYKGEVDGSWGNEVTEALAKFANAVNRLKQSKAFVATIHRDLISNEHQAFNEFSEYTSKMLDHLMTCQLILKKGGNFPGSCQRMWKTHVTLSLDLKTARIDR